MRTEAGKGYGGIWRWSYGLHDIDVIVRWFGAKWQYEMFVAMLIFVYLRFIFFELDKRVRDDIANRKYVWFMHLVSHLLELNCLCFCSYSSTMIDSNTRVNCTGGILMGMRRDEAEDWILWSYGGLCVVLLPLIQIFDAILTDTPESWYVNFSFILSASAAITLVGILLLGAFQQPYVYLLPVCTVICMWPLLWLLQIFDLWVIRVLDVRGDVSLYIIVLSVASIVAALPRLINSALSAMRYFMLVRHQSV